MLAVVQQLIDGLVHIRQGRVALLFFERRIDLRKPAFGQLFERADIEVAVMEKGLQPWHVLDQKAPVLPDGVAAHGRLALGHIGRQKLQ